MDRINYEVSLRNQRQETLIVEGFVTLKDADEWVARVLSPVAATCAHVVRIKDMVEVRHWVRLDGIWNRS